MIAKKLIGGSTVYWYNHHINMFNIEPQPDGTVSGYIEAHGGFCFPGSWLNPITSIADGIESTIINAPVADFCIRVDAKIASGEKSVLNAIKAVLEDIYTEQLPK